MIGTGIRTCLAACIIILTAVTASAQTYPLSLELNGNGSVAEADLGFTWAILADEKDESSASVTLNAGLLYNYDDYSIGNIGLSMSHPLSGGLTVRYGIKGLLGQVDLEEDRKDGDLAGIGFFFSGIYDFTIESGVPFELEAYLGLAPSATCFQDADDYFEVKSTFGFHILTEKRGTVFIGYRYLKVQFDASPDDWDISDDGVFVGVKFRF